MGKGSCSSSVEFSWHAEDAVQFTGHGFTFRPLPTKDAKLHKHKSKSPEAKTVQPQEVNSSLNWFSFCDTQGYDLPLSYIILTVRLSFVHSNA